MRPLPQLDNGIRQQHQLGVNARTNVIETLRGRCDVGCVVHQMESGLAAGQKFLSGAKG
jgi:hypothetical protein